MKKKQPKPGDRRRKRWFAILPVTVGRETRWFETVAVEYEYWEAAGVCGFFAGWKPLWFLLPNDKEQAAP